jgi:hypothetical protein
LKATEVNGGWHPSFEFFGREMPMRIQRKITQFIALSLAILIATGTAPLSAAEVATAANIGSVSAVGSVQLRGVGISEGTLFSGDSVKVAPEAYAKVVLIEGHKVELDGSSNVTISKDAGIINIHMTAGNIGFTGGQKPVRVRVGGYEITGNGQARGTVAFMGAEAFGVRAIDGTVSVRNTATKQSFTVAKGTTRLISLRDSNPAGVLLASTSPTAIPAAPAMPAARQLSSGAKKGLMIASILGTAAAIAVLMTKNDDSDSEAAARLRLTTAAQTLSNVSATAAAASTAAVQVDTASASATAAINAAATSQTFTAAEKAALVARANTLTNAAKASQTTIATLKTQLDALNNSLANANASTAAAIEAQIQTILTNTNAEVAKLNTLIADLNKLVADANAEVPNLIPAPAVQPVAPAAPASGSNPT